MTSHFPSRVQHGASYTWSLSCCKHNENTSSPMIRLISIHQSLSKLLHCCLETGKAPFFQDFTLSAVNYFWSGSVNYLAIATFAMFTPKKYAEPPPLGPGAPGQGPGPGGAQPYPARGPWGRPLNYLLRRIPERQVAWPENSNFLQTN